MAFSRSISRLTAIAAMLAAASVAVVVDTGRARAANRDDSKPVTDEDVLESMRKGAHYLLGVLAKKNPANNWESKFDDKGNPPNGGWAGTNFGGETALCLYALLHVGEGVQDDPELGPLLHFNSKELTPVVKWLSELRPDATYTAGLRASALALVPKETEPGKAAVAALKADASYIASAMDVEGGYDYQGPVAGMEGQRPHGFMVVWGWYWGAKSTGNQGQAEQYRIRLEAIAKQTSRYFGGYQGMVQLMVLELKQREADAKARKDAAGVTKIQNEQKEFQRMANELSKVTFDKRDTEKNTFRAGFSPKGDLSNSQYGTLGAWALSDAEVEMPLGYWLVADKFWRLAQHPDGMWPYNARAAGDKGKPSMTMAGLASLYITTSMVDTQIRLDPKPEPEIERGLKWLNENFTPEPNWYHMYGIERVGLASGLKTFGTRNWYTEIAKLALREQRDDGSWIGGEGNDTVATAYTLLFLARGRNPVMFNKLQYDEGPWNARPRDNANITSWISKKVERPINWQVVNLKVDPAEWADAPVLLITGSKALTFTPEEIGKLRAYVNAGGMIFSNADGGKPEFTESVKKIASQLVEEDGKPKYEMRELGKDHILFSNKNELWQPIPNPPKILAMSNGVREIWVHSTVDMGASWQGKKFSNVDHYNFPANLYRYASGKAILRTKLQSLNVAAGADAGAAARTINLARIDYAGNWDPEPGAWPRLAKILRRDAKTDLQIKNVKMGALDFKTTPVAHMTGTTGFPVNAGDVAALKKFLAEGGTLVADAAGANANFKTSFEKLLQEATGKSPTAIPVDGKIYNGSIPDSVATPKTDYRMFYRLTVGNRTTPQLKGVEINGRWAVIYSEEDVTSGLLGTNTWGILGYSADSAVNVARNVLLYAADPKGGKE